jgi:hypothetical protein
MKKGLSFTLTLVVVGVILLMTALSVITLGGSSINAFFETIGGEQEEAVQQNAIAEACQEKMARIDRNYCNYYIQSHQYVDGSTGDGPPSGSSYTHPDISGYSDYNNEAGDEWQEVADSTACQEANTQRTAEPRGYDAAANDADGYAYDETASSRGCSWVEGYSEVPTVNVQGQTYDCVQEGVIDDVRCPAQ